MQSFTFHPKLLLRAPVRPVDMRFTRESLCEVLDDLEFLEAIYIAAPVLYAECCKWKKNPELVQPDRERKLFRSLAKYYMRMTTRSTPFGLFSGCTIGEWQGENAYAYDHLKFTRHTRLDMHCICLLSEAIGKMPLIKEKLSYQPNSSIYHIGNSIRYVEYSYHSGKRQYQISAVPIDDLLQNIIISSEKGLLYGDLLSLVKSFNASEEEADHYLKQLISAQVLVSNLEPAITDGDPLQHILFVLKNIHDTTDNEKLLALIIQVEEVADMIAALDKFPLNEISAYELIIEKLTQFELPFDQSKVFQVDLVSANKRCGLTTDLQNQLIAAIEGCEFLAEPFTNPRLKEFRQQFVHRYGTAEKSLLQVLDEECGIGYGKGADEAKIQDVEEPWPLEQNKNYSSGWSTRTRLLFDKLMCAAREGAKAIIINPEELRAVKTSKRMQLPPSMAVVFRCFDEPDNGTKLYFEHASGSSALNVLSRFAYADPEITTWCQEISTAEEANNTGICFFDVVHLPEHRTGNILLHPRFRKNESPYLARSSTEKGYQIKAADLLISVKNDRFVLRDRHSGRELVPRLSSAHNYRYRSLPLYWFLGELQHQHLQPQLGFSWGPLYEILHFFPRVYYKSVVLSLATWKIQRKDFDDILDASPENLQQKIQLFKARFELPDIFLLTDGDNQLPVYTENNLSVMAFLDTIRNREMIILQEMPGADNKNISDGMTNFTRQFIASIIQSAPVYKQSSSVQQDVNWNQTQRSFPPASEWVYYKLYCGEKQANRLLGSLIIPLVAEIRQKRLSDKWFFIRYSDPDFHIRLRFHSTDSCCIQEIITIVSEKLAIDDNAPIIWKLQLDTYSREIERYGLRTITNSETVFFIDSEAVLYMLKYAQSIADNNFHFCWLFKAIDDMLEAFALSLANRQMLIHAIRERFAKELHAGKEMNKQLDMRYRMIRSVAEKLLAGDTGSWPQKLSDRLAKRFNDLKLEALRIKNILNEPTAGITVAGLLSSYIHLSCNRVFAIRARQQEFMIYDFLDRYYRSRLARESSVSAVLHQK